MRILLSAFILLTVFSLSAQVTIDNSSLPDVGDAIVYDLFVDFPDTVTFKENGANLSWSYQDFQRDATVTESFRSIEGSPLADTFPGANMLIDIGFFEAAALRSDNAIEVVGVLAEGLEGFGIQGGVDLGDNYTLNQTPINMGDSYDDSFEFGVTIPTDLIPGLDSLESPLPGATIDSIRFTIEVSKQEEATAWGSMDLEGKVYDVLKVEQTDKTATKIEIGLGLLGSIIWFDVTDLLGDVGGIDELGFGDSEIVTYRFMTPEVVGPLLEFNQSSLEDTLGNTTVTVNGRIHNELTLNSNDIVESDLSINIFPNPTQDYLQFNSETFNQADLIVRTYDGKILLESKNFNIIRALDVSFLDSGIYILEFHHERGISPKIFQKL